MIIQKWLNVKLSAGNTGFGQLKTSIRGNRCSIIESKKTYTIGVIVSVLMGQMKELSLS